MAGLGRRKTCGSNLRAAMALLLIVATFLLFEANAYDGALVSNMEHVIGQPRIEHLTVRFVNETYHPSMADKTSTEFREFEKKIDTQFESAFGNVANFLKIDVHSLSAGSVIANMTVTYIQITGTELPLLQTAIEEQQMLNSMPVGLFYFSSTTMVSPPLSLNVSALSQTEILVSWSPVPTTSTAGTVIGYSIFYRKLTDTIYNIGAVVVGQETYVADYLEAYTTYTFRVAAFTNDSIGFTSAYADERTLEGIPTEFIDNVTCNAQSSISATLQWSPISLAGWNGFMMGYIIYYREYQSTDPLQSVSFSPTDISGIIYNLMGFKFYEMQIAAYTSTGVGPTTWVLCSTLQGVPMTMPTNIQLVPFYSPVRMHVSWTPMSAGSMNGVLEGYKVCYGVTRDNGQTIAFPVVTCKSVSPYNFFTVIQWFTPYSEIEVKVAGYTSVGNGPFSNPIYADTCRCPKFVYTNWYAHPAYVYNNGTSMRGAFVDYMDKMFLGVCGHCVEYDHLYNTTGVSYPKLYYDRTRDGTFPDPPNEEQLIKSLSFNSHIFMPIYASANIRVYQGNYRFVQLVKSQGAAFIVRSQLSQLNSGAVVSSIFGVWPMFVIIFLCTYLAGIIMCITDRDINPEFSRSNFLIGSLQGFWCAFITMTTLGYGDKVPMSITARIITVMWSFIGLVLTSILIGSICTSITVIDTTAYPKLYGSKVAVLNNTVEMDLAIRRNAFVNTTGRVFTEVEQLFDVLQAKEVDGVLLDFFLAQDHISEISKRKLKIKSIIHKPNGYGIVLSAEMIALETFVRSFVTSNPLVLPNTKDPELSGTGDGTGDSAIDITMTVITIGMKYMAIALGVMFILGLIWHLIRTMRKRSKVDPKGYSNSTMELSEVAKSFNQEMAERIEKLEKKHQSEIIELLRTKNYSFGFKGFKTFRSFDEVKIKNKMLFAEIASKDLQ